MFLSVGAEHLNFGLKLFHVQEMDESKWEKQWTDLVMIPLICAFITRYMPGSDKTRWDVRSSWALRFNGTITIIYLNDTPRYLLTYENCKNFFPEVSTEICFVFLLDFYLM